MNWCNLLQTNFLEILLPVVCHSKIARVYKTKFFHSYCQHKCHQCHPSRHDNVVSDGRCQHAGRVDSDCGGGERPPGAQSHPEDGKDHEDQLRIGQKHVLSFPSCTINNNNNVNIYKAPCILVVIEPLECGTTVKYCSSVINIKLRRI